MYRVALLQHLFFSPVAVSCSRGRRRQKCCYSSGLNGIVAAVGAAVFAYRGPPCRRYDTTVGFILVVFFVYVIFFVSFSRFALLVYLFTKYLKARNIK